MRLDNSGMFTGLEREGLLSATPTLFVQGSDTPWATIEEALSKTGVRHLELGSGRVLDWSRGVLESALVSPLLDYVTVETASIAFLTDYDLANEKLHLFVTLLMPEAIAPKGFQHDFADARLIQWFQKNPRVQIKIATDVHLMVMNNQGLKSFNRNDIFVADKVYA